MSNDELLQTLLVQQAAAKARYETLTEIINELRSSVDTTARTTIAQAIRTKRRDLGLTQEKLGTQAGYGAGAGIAISRIESGKVTPNPKKLKTICEILDIDLNSLFLESEEPEETSTDTTDQ